jgi:hypothetical protein
VARLAIKRSSAAPLIAPMLLYGCGCSLAAIIGWAVGDLWVPVLFIMSSLAALLGWRLMRWPDTWSRYFSFGAILLLMCALNRLFYIADYLMNGVRFNEWPFSVSAPEVAVFKGEVITMIGTFMTVLAWKFAGGMQVSPRVVLQRESTRYLSLVVAYTTSLAAMALSASEPEVAAELGQLLPTLLGMGLVCALLIPIIRIQNGLKRLGLVALLSLPFVFLASGSGMKESIILAILPTAISSWQVFRHPVSRAGLILAGMVTIGLITSYVDFYRGEVWNDDRQTSTGQVLNDFVDRTHQSGLDDVTSTGAKGFIKRNNASVYRGWAVSIADERELHPDLVFSPLIYVFIPRILWPDKPLIRQGWEYSGLVFGQQYISWSGSSTAAGLYPSLYLGGGCFAVIMGAILIGVLLALMTRIAFVVGGSTTAGVYMFAMLPLVIRLDEAWTVGAITGPIISCVYVVGIMTAAKMISSVLRRPAVLGDR